MTDLASPSPRQSLPADPAVPRRPFYRFAKRSFDVLTSGLGLLLVSPVMLAAAIAVKLDSPGPVLFAQERMGKNFRPFRIFKFRTMVVDAEKRGAQITAGADPRITRSGRLLRKTKLDELPQLWNVLVGDMSLVGPRPEVPRYVEMFRDDYTTVLAVRPGITDLASVKYRDEAEQLATAADPQREYVERILPDKIALARQYVAGATFFGDIAIVLQTLVRIAR